MSLTNPALPAIRNRGLLGRMMGWLGVTHVRRHHAHYRSRGGGHLYQGRFKSFGVQQDQTHFLTLCRYVEANPVRAGVVRSAPPLAMVLAAGAAGGESTAEPPPGALAGRASGQLAGAGQPPPQRRRTGKTADQRQSLPTLRLRVLGADDGPAAGA